MSGATPTPSSDLSDFLGEDPNVNRLYDNVQATVPGVGLAMVKMQSWNTIEDFFIRSTCRREVAYWQMPPDVNRVDFNPFSAEWLVCWILHYQGLHYARIEPHSATLLDLTYPVPTTTRNGSVLLALKPVDFAQSLSPMLWSQWFETILAGVLTRLYQQPAKPYSSPQMAQFYGRRYTAGVGQARAIADHQWTDGQGRWIYPYFSHGRLKN